MSNNYLLLHDVEERECLLPADFMVAVRGKVERDVHHGDTVENVIDIKRGKVKIDVTVVYIHDNFSIPVLETPQQIYDMVQEINYAATYEQESDEETPDPGEAEQATEDVPELSPCVC